MHGIVILVDVKQQVKDQESPALVLFCCTCPKEGLPCTAQLWVKEPPCDSKEGKLVLTQNERVENHRIIWVTMGPLKVMFILKF